MDNTASVPKSVNVSDLLGWGWGPAAGIALGLAALVGLGVLSEFILVRPFLARPGIVLLAVITTLSAAIFLENSSLLIWGGRYKQMPPLIEGKVGLLSTAISAHEVLIIGVAPLTLLALWLFLKYICMINHGVVALDVASSDELDHDRIMQMYFGKG